MKATIFRRGNALALIGDSPAWTTGQDSGHLLSLVQNSEMSITNNRQNLKQLGSKTYAVNDIIRASEVSISMGYYLSPYVSNEILLGLNAKSGTYLPAFSGISEKNYNLYFLLETDYGKDAFEEAKKTSSINFSGFDAMTFGNCYLNSYNVNFSINQIPTVSISLSADNTRFENLKNNFLSIPAINSISGNNNGSGYLNLGTVYKTITGLITGDYQSRTEFNPRVATSYASNFSLQNLQVGGVALGQNNNPILQSFDLSFALDRTVLYSIGSNYPYKRKLQYPINGQAQISCLVSGISSGNWQSILTGESGYNFEISFTDFAESQYSKTGFYKIENAKLDSMSYSLAVNGIMQFNASFSFQATDTGGFFMKRLV